jgi:lipoprotein NlpD
VTPVTPAEPSATARASDAHVINWGWPASGKIIQSFNTNTKGIDIAGEPGEPVHAAADGKVMYAGNGVRGLGNLVLLGHSDGFITAYAHNQALLVKTGQQVKKGTKIASIGQTDTTSPRLHFEIRRRGTPVNPLSYLPAR